MNKECKRHRWRLGSGSARLIDGKIKTEYTNIWCERCDRRLKAYHDLKYTFEEYCKRRLSKHSSNGDKDARK